MIVFPQESDIMRPSSRLLFAALALTLSGCGGRGVSPPPPARVITAAERLYYDNTGGIQDSLRMVIRDQQRFQQIWNRATSTQISPPPVPTIDFAKSMVVVVGAGRRNTDDEIRVDSAAYRERTTVQGKKEQVMEIMVLLRTGCGGLEAAGYPLEIVRLPAFDGPIEFNERTVPAQGCDAPEASAPARTPVRRPPPGR